MMHVASIGKNHDMGFGSQALTVSGRPACLSLAHSAGRSRSSGRVSKTKLTVLRTMQSTMTPAKTFARIDESASSKSAKMRRRREPCEASGNHGIRCWESSSSLSARVVQLMERCDRTLPTATASPVSDMQASTVPGRSANRHDLLGCRLDLKESLQDFGRSCTMSSTLRQASLPNGMHAMSGSWAKASKMPSQSVPSSRTRVLRAFKSGPTVECCES
mmetsp:Transcript_56986/g.185197  ORF Transcript_56986/g.185197 Transcript_56986/m.185197 type:complete len:218 (-) Transcript_56986:236-889(-)